MKTITLHLTEVNTERCTGCYYLNKWRECTNPAEYTQCVGDDGQCYIFEEETEECTQN